MQSKQPFTLLFDLDDTLLKNEMGVFLPAYFQAILNSLSGVIPGENLAEAFLDATQLMLANNRPDQTLAETFYTHFLAEMNVRYEDLLPVIEKFYRDVYPDLQALTEVVPGAADLVRQLLAEGYSLSVATNPLLPAAATRQRVDWADLPIPWPAFNMVTSFENFHFAKPNPSYYAEVLAYLGWPEGPVVMIGNDPINDIDGAGKLGLATYFTGQNGACGSGDTHNEKHGAGSLIGLTNWLSATPPELLIPDFRTPQGILAVLNSTPAAIQTLLRHTDLSAWKAKEDGEWSAQETLAHLRDVEILVNQPRAEAFLSDEPPFIPGVDTDSWHADGFGDLEEPEVLLEAFMQARKATLEILNGMTRDGWAQPARHAIFGPTDLLEIANIMSGHDRTHIRQIRERFGGREIWH